MQFGPVLLGITSYTMPLKQLHASTTKVYKLKSLSIFFPFYNDAGTVERQIKYAYEVGNCCTHDLEVIAVIGGASEDNTAKKIYKMKRKFPELVIVDKSDNWEGYAVIKYGFKTATKDWVFYTDGDAQYHLEEDLESLVKAQKKTGASVVNGYKVSRQDAALRRFFGGLYARISSFVFELPIRDTDCDFRLIKGSLLKKVTLESHDASILPELIKKLDLLGARFAEVPVNHYQREYGVSNYSAFGLLKEKLSGDIKLYFRMRGYRSFAEKSRVLRFGSVGLLSIAIQATLYNVGLAKSTIEPFILAFLADQLAILVAFSINSKYTFKQTPTIGKFYKYYATVIVATFIQSGIILFVTSMFGRSLLISNAGYICGLVIGFLWSYGVNSRVIWRRRTFATARVNN